MKGKTTITALGDVPADTTETYEHTFTRSAYVTGINISTYVGQAQLLRYSFYRVTDGTPTNLLNHLGNKWVAGNGEELRLPVRERFEEDDTLRIEVTNATGGNSGYDPYEYSVSARLPVEYETSTFDRLLGRSGSDAQSGEQSGFLAGVL